MVLPRGCAGCDTPDEVLCAGCRGGFSHTICRSLPLTVMGEGYSCASYRDTARHAILSWKDHGDEECDGVFSSLLAGLAVRCGAVDRNAPVTLIPAPSSRSSMVRRGRWHMSTVTGHMAATLVAQGYAVDMMPALRTMLVSTKSVQAGGAAQRSQRIAGNIAVTGADSIRGRRTIVIDDIMTTGATMRQCIAALDQAGCKVITALSLASVER
ncbi:ComF family protein [Bifidobacterium sp. SO1]|nr:ComF family protein [Bifidobacterium sp. SO1]MBW3078316.1 ComF family protein [Bifidobacterium simiiventris]